MLRDFAPDCNATNIGGVEMEILFSCASEHKIDPRSKSQMPNAVDAPGRTNEIGENYDFSDAPVGEGCFRRMTIIADTGEIMSEATVTDGTSKVTNTFKFKLKGFGPVEKEFAEKVSSCCGMVMLVPDKSGVVHELGRKKSPAVVKTFKGGTGGDFRGFEYEVVASGRTPRTIDLTAFPPDLTPN